MMEHQLDELLAIVADRDIHLYLDEGKLKFRAPKDAMDRELISSIKAYKPQIIQMLSDRTEKKATRENPAERQPSVSFAQERLWFLQQLEEQNPAYNIQAVFKLEGELDIQILKKSLDRIMERHESLRTRFVDTGDTIRPAVEQNLLFPLEITAVSPDTLDLTQIHEQAKSDAGTPFDLTKAPLIKARAIHDSQGLCYLILTIHHIITDGWSHTIFFNELTLLYRSFANGDEPNLPELSEQYRNWAERQRERMSEGGLTEGLQRMVQKLEGANHYLDLPRDYPRPEIQSSQGRMISLKLDETLSREFKALCSRFDSTLFIGLFTLFQLWLYRITGQQDLLTGTPLSGRNDTASEHLIGFFINTLLVRTRMEKEQTFEELLTSVRDEILELFQYQEVPFEKIVEAVQPARKLGYHPLFQVFFNMLSHSQKKIDLPGITITQLDLPETATPFDITLYAIEHEERLTLELLYATDLFSEERAREMLAQIEYLIRQVTEESSRPLDSYSLRTRTVTLKGADISQNGKFKPAHGLPLRLHKSFSQRRHTPSIQSAEGAIHYSELDILTRNLSGKLKEHGATSIGILSSRNRELPIAVVSALISGIPFIILDAAWPSRRIDAMIQETGVTCILTCGETSHNTDLAARFRKDGITVVSCSSVEREEPGFEWPSPPPAEKLAYWISTSGTSGNGKLVAGNRRPLDHFVDWYLKRFEVDPGETFAMLSGLTHDPLLRDILVPLTAGATLAIPDPDCYQYPHRMVQWLREAGITTMHVTPARMQMILDAAEQENLEIPGMKRILFGGDKLTAPLLSRVARLFPNARLFNGYGTTETPQLASCHEVTHTGSPTQRPQLMSVGNGIDGSVLRVITPSGLDAGVGEPGEVTVQSRYLSLGYWQNQSVSDSHFHMPEGELPQYRTGDRGRILPDGNIVIEGRLDRQVNIHGYRIDPDEIEHSLATHPSLKQAVVWAEEDRLLAACLPENEEPEQSGEDLQQELAEYLAQTLPETMIPDRIYTVNQFPLTANGKVDMRQLSDQVTVQEKSESEFTAPRDRIERILCELWRTLTGREEVGIDDDFFRIGGHSLLAAKINNRIRTELGIEIPLRDHFQHTTVRTLSEAVRASLSRPFSGITKAPTAACYPLSHAQRRIWVLSKLDETSIAYSMPRSLQLTGRLNPDHIVQILESLVEHEDSLRTTFREQNGEPVQVVQDQINQTFRFEDLRENDDPKARAEELAEEDANRPFNLENGPLFRCSLLRTGEDTHILLFNMHHIISDGWSMALVEDAFTKGLRQICDGGDCNGIPKAPIQYRDYAVWQQTFLETKQSDTLREFWHHQFRDGAPLLEMPTDYPRPAVKTYRGSRITRQFEGRVAAAVRHISHEFSCSRYVVLNGLVTTLLHRYSGSSDFVVGTPSAGRLTTELEHRIGCFVNMLPVRVQPEPGKRFSEYLAEIKSTTIQAFTHEAYPYDKLVDELGLARHSDRSPLFDVAIVYQNPDIKQLELPGLQIEPFIRAEGTAKYDLTFTFEESGEGLTLEIEYNTDLFRRERAEQICRHFEQLALAVSAAPETAISRLKLLDREEEARILTSSSGPASSWPEYALLHELFSVQAAKTPDAVALICSDRQMSYLDLEKQSDAVARYLRKEGLEPGGRVVIDAIRNESTIAGILGILKAGGTYVPVDPTYPAERNRFIIADCGARFYLDAGRLQEAELYTDDAPSARTHCDPDQPAYIIYTSGSTGKPKGCQVTHRNVVRLMLNSDHPFEFNPADTWISTHSFCFDFSVWEMYGALLYGGKLVIAQRDEARNPEAVRTLVSRHRVTVLNQTPAAFYNLIEAEKSQQTHELHHLRYIIFGGDRLEPANLEPWTEWYDPRHTKLINMYGITETTVHVSYCPLTRKQIRSGGGSSPIGVPLPQTSIYILDEHRQLMPEGVPGEIYVGGTGVSLGYLNRPDLTAERFLPDPFNPGGTLYRSGDVGLLRFDGTFEYRGRNDHQVQLHGFRIETGEIEALLSRHEQILKAVVLLTGEEESSKKLVAFCVPNRQAETMLSTEEIRAWLQNDLPEQMIPARLVTLDELPLTANGKVDRRKLLELEQRVSLPSGKSGEEPGDSVQELIREIWQEVLNCPGPGLDINFFDLGGNSLSLMKVHTRLRPFMDPPLPIVDLFRHTTIRSLARHLKGSGNLDPETLKPSETDRTKAL